MLVTLYIVFSFIMKLNVPHYQLFLLLGIIVWNYFAEATNNSLQSLAANASILKEHKIEAYILVISACMSTVINLILSLIVFMIMLIIFKVSIQFLSIVSIFYFFLLIIFTVGVSLLITGIYIQFRDMIHIWTFSLLIGFWLSPIIYSEMILPADIRKIYMINPVARIISHLRNTFIYNYLDNFSQIIITLIICIGILFMGFWVFHIFSKNISEKL